MEVLRFRVVSKYLDFLFVWKFSTYSMEVVWTSHDFPYPTLQNVIYGTCTQNHLNLISLPGRSGSKTKGPIDTKSSEYLLEHMWDLKTKFQIFMRNRFPDIVNKKKWFCGRRTDQNFRKNHFCIQVVRIPNFEISRYQEFIFEWTHRQTNLRIQTKRIWFLVQPKSNIFFQFQVTR